MKLGLNGNWNPNLITKYWKNQKPPDTNALKKSGKNFKDPYFPPNLNSLTSRDSNGDFVDAKEGPTQLQYIEEDCPNYKSYTWKRPSEIRKAQWGVFSGKIEFDDVKQGGWGDCYFLSSISAWAEFPYLIKEKFRTTEYSEIGYYEVILYIDGEWQIVFVDDYFPYSPAERDFAFASPNGNELWAILLEKVWAKTNGGFSNIIAGIVSEPVAAWTGFPTKSFIHSRIDPDDLFETIEQADKEGTIMSSASKHDDSGKKGIVAGHAYTLIGAKSWQAKRLYWIKLRNPWGHHEWTGDWSDNSRKWTDETKKYFQYINADDGVFWIDIDNYISSFDSSYICYLWYGAQIKNYYFEYTKYFRSPVVFNIQIFEKAKTSVYVQFKNWRFNRDIHDVVHPFTVIWCKYEDDRSITKWFCDYSLFKDIEIIEDWEPGYYVWWMFCNYESVLNDPNFKYCVSVSCVKSFKCEFNGLDSDFQLIQYLLVENYRNESAGTIASTKDFLITSDKKVQNKAGLFNIWVYNKKKCWIKLNLTLKQNNLFVFPPYNQLTSFTMQVPPLQTSAWVCFIKGTGTSSFGYSTSISIHSQKTNQVPIERFEDFLIFDIQNNKASDSSVRSHEYKFVAQDKVNELPKFTSNYVGEDVLKEQNKEVTKSSLEKEYPKEFQIINQHFLDQTKRPDLYWNTLIKNEGTYIGQINKSTGELAGVGIYIWKASRITYIGTWAANKMEGNGFLFSSNFTIMYEGMFKNGLKSGTGVFYINENEYYIGDFMNDKMNGQGTYHFANGDTWEGRYTNGMKNGVGIMYFKGAPQKYLVEFENDNYLGKTKINSNEEKQIEEASLDDKSEKQKPKFLSNLAAFKKFLTNRFLQISSDLYNQKRKIISNVLVEAWDEEIKESVSDKKHRIFMEKIELLKKEEPFMMEQLLEIYSAEEENLALIQIDKSDESRYVGGVKPSGNNLLKQGRGALFDGTHYYIGYFQNDKPAGYFRKYGSDKKIWFTGILDGNYQIAGRCKMYLRNGDMYNGNFLKGNIHGQGTYFFSTGDSWTGQFVDNQFHGVGKYFFNNGLITETITYNMNKVVSRTNLQRDDYSDPNSENFFHTIRKTYPGVTERLLALLPVRKECQLKWTTFKFKSGQIFIGQISEENKYSGRGCMILTDESVRYYVGYFKDNCYCGFGTFYSEDWSIQYEGEFMKNEKHGFGKYYFPDKSQYIGHYLNNQKNGAAVYIYCNGSRFEGYFLNGEKHDKGTHIEKDFTTVQESEYKEGNIISQGNIINCTRRKYEADIIQSQISKLSILYPKHTKLFLALAPVKDSSVLLRVAKQELDGMYIGEVNRIGFKHGRGVLKESRGTEYYVGYFMFNEKEGQGTIYYDDNKPKYIGNFHNNKPLGKGKYFYERDETLEGEFNEVGEGKGVYTFQNGCTWKGQFYAWTLNGLGDYYDRNGMFLSRKNYKYNILV